MARSQRRAVVVFISAVMLVGTQSVRRVLSQTPAQGPVAPAVLSSTANKLGWVPSLQIAPPQAGPLTADPLEAFTPASLHGTLIYLPRIVYPHIMFAETFFTFRSAKPTGDATANYLVDLPSHPQVFDPLFSPNGDALVFKVGSSEDPWPHSQLCLWNFLTNRVSVVNSTPITDYNRRVAWSPDGRRIAYILGGDDNPRLPSPVRLFAYSLATGKNRQVAHNNGARNFAWTTRDTLLYTVTPPRKQREDGSYPLPVDLYESAADRGPQRKILANIAGGDIAPSPNNRWIAFLGWGGRQGALRVCLYDRRRHTRQLLRPISASEYPLCWLRWTPNSRRLILITASYQAEHRRDTHPEKAGKGLGRAVVSVINVTQPREAVRRLATITAQDFSIVPDRFGVDAQFQPMQIAHDGTTLFLRGPNKKAR